MSSSWTTLFLLNLQGHQQHECWSLDSIKAVFKTGGGSIAHSPPNPRTSVAGYLTTPEATFHDLSCDQCEGLLRTPQVVRLEPKRRDQRLHLTAQRRIHPSNTHPT